METNKQRLDAEIARLVKCLRTYECKCNGCKRDRVEVARKAWCLMLNSQTLARVV